MSKSDPMDMDDIHCSYCGAEISRPGDLYNIKNHIYAHHRKLPLVEKRRIIERTQPSLLTATLREISFDDESPQNLMRFWGKYSRAKRKDAEHLIGDRRPGFTRIAGMLANYASNLATAKSCRARGTIDTALMYERIADGIYDRLPNDLKW